MNTTNFEYMLTLEKTGTVTQTAEHFFVSPSAISQCLKNEEKQFGYPIFERKDRKMVPTPAGQIYLKGARHILQIRSQTLAQIHHLSESTASFRIAIVPLLSHFVQFTLKPKFACLFPNETFKWITADSRTCVTYIDNHLADFALATIPSSLSTNRQEITLGQDRLLPVVPKAYLRTKLNHIPSLSDCTSIPFILLKQGSYMRECQNQVLAKNHLILNRVYEVDHSLKAKEFLEDGKGIAFLPESIITEEIRAHCHILTVSPEITFFYRLIENPNLKEKTESISGINNRRTQTETSPEMQPTRYTDVANAICRLFKEKVELK